MQRSKPARPSNVSQCSAVLYYMGRIMAVRPRPSDRYYGGSKRAKAVSLLPCSMPACLLPLLSFMLSFPVLPLFAQFAASVLACSIVRPPRPLSLSLRTNKDFFVLGESLTERPQ